MSEADLQKAFNEARDQYMNRMQLACQSDTPSMYQEAIINLHSKEVSRATARFKTEAKALSANPSDIHQKLKTLTEELNNHEQEFFDLNLAKSFKTVEKGKTAFNKAIERITQGERLCINSLDVEKVHQEAIQAAEKAYEEDRKKDAGPDWDRHLLIEHLVAKVAETRILNTKNNKLIGYELAIKYFQEMMGKCTREPRLSEEVINTEHERARSRALEAFLLKRNRRNQYKDDILKFKVDQYMMIQYSELKQMVANASNMTTFKLAVSAYDEVALSPSKLWQYCLHPDDLKKKHEDALCRALRAFRPNRPCSEGFHDSEKEERDLHFILENRYRALADINKDANAVAEETGYFEFRFKYNSLINNYMNRWTGLKQRTRRECHDKAIVVGIDAFYEKRRDRKEHVVDTYKDKLLSRAKNYAQVDLPDR